MNCPDHGSDVEQCNCELALSLMESAGKYMSDGYSQDEADLKAVELYERSIGKQEKLF